MHKVNVEVERSMVPGERRSTDIYSPKVTSIGGPKHWLLMLDDIAYIPFSFTLSYKDMLEIGLVPSIQILKALHDIEVKISRCDNAGENQSFERTCEQEVPGLKFEYTTTSTSHQNGQVERKFKIHHGRIRDKLLGYGNQMSIRNCLRPAAANTVTGLDSILVSPKETTSSF